MAQQVQEAVEIGLPSLTPVEVQAQLCLTLLRCSQFAAAKPYLTGQHRPASQRSFLHAILFSTLLDCPDVMAMHLWLCPEQMLAPEQQQQVFARKRAAAQQLCA